MKDPTVQVHSQPIKKKEIDSLGEINFNQHHFDIGVQFYYEIYENGQLKKIPFDIPDNVGRFAVVNSTLKSNWSYTPFINCTGVFKDVNEDFGERERQALKNGHCMDTNAATAMIKGTKVFETDKDPVQKIEIQFVPCYWENEGSDFVAHCGGRYRSWIDWWKDFCD